MSDTRKFSSLQEAIFAFVVAMGLAILESRRPKNLVVIARAGTGKTTTIIEAVSRLPNNLKILVCAFNKSIARELTEKAPKHVEAKTLHSIGFAVVRRNRPRVSVDENKGRDCAEAALKDAGRTERGQVDRQEVGMVVKLMSLAKNTLARNKADIRILCEQFGILAEDDESDLTIDKLVDITARALNYSLEDTSRIDFDDMIFLPVFENMSCAWYDIVVVDESQDMNACQLALAQMLRKPNGGIVVVGDDRQAIYAWRGADKDALPRMTQELGAEVLPLSITYRCPKSVVASVQHIVPDYQAAESAPEGEISTVVMKQLDPKPGDFVLSRKNAAMVSPCLACLARGIPAVIAGRDVSKSLVTLVKKSKAKTVPDLAEWLESYRTKEMARLTRMNAPEAKMQEVADKIECLNALSEGLEKIEELLARLETLFTDDDTSKKVVFSSVHKAKGLERERVWMLADTFYIKRGDPVEEANLWYVASTRTKQSLTYVREKI